jgi:PAS domain-containing protein
MDETKDIMDIAKPQWLEQMEGILETLNEGVLIADADDHVLFVNSVFEGMTGIFRGDILDRDAGQCGCSANASGGLAPFDDGSTAPSVA